MTVALKTQSRIEIREARQVSNNQDEKDRVFLPLNFTEGSGKGFGGSGKDIAPTWSCQKEHCCEIYQ